MTPISEQAIGEGRIARLQRDDKGAVSVLVVDAESGRVLAFLPVADRSREAIGEALVAARAVRPAVSARHPRFNIDAATEVLLDDFFTMNYPLVPVGNNIFRDHFHWTRQIQASELGRVAAAAPSDDTEGGSLQGPDLTAYALDSTGYALRWIDATGRLSTQSRREVFGMSFPAFVRFFATIAATSDSLATGPLGEAWEKALRRYSETKPRYTLDELLRLPRGRARDDENRSVIVLKVAGDQVQLKRSNSPRDVQEIIAEIAERVREWHYGYPFAVRT